MGQSKKKYNDERRMNHFFLSLYAEIISIKGKTSFAESIP